jgi:hypothetical protein
MIVVQTIGFCIRAISCGKIAPRIGVANHRKLDSWTVPAANAELRTREHLTATEVESFIDAHRALHFASAVSPLVERWGTARLGWMGKASGNVSRWPLQGLQEANWAASAALVVAKMRSGCRATNSFASIRMFVTLLRWDSLDRIPGDLQLLAVRDD